MQMDDECDLKKCFVKGTCSKRTSKDVGIHRRDGKNSELNSDVQYGNLHNSYWCGKIDFMTIV